MSESRRLYLIRHGETHWNRDGRFQGHTDIGLSKYGVQQARRVAARLAAWERPPEAVWSSDLARSRQTAEAIAHPLGLQVVVTPALRETMLGDWEGLTAAEIEARGDLPQLERYRMDSYRHRPPGGESLDAVWHRVLEAAARIRALHPSGCVAIVGHGGSLRALICDALNAPVTSMRHVWLENGSLSVIDDLPDGRKRLVLLNDTSHLSVP